MLKKRTIENEFDNFLRKNGTDNDDITIDIDDNDYQILMINIHWKNNLCMYFDYNSSDNSFFIHKVQHCGANIPLLLQFVKELLDKYGSTYSLMDVSYFYFQNEQTREKSFIRLKELYTLCYGKTFYSKILSNDPPSTEPTIDIKIINSIPSFSEEEREVIQSILERKIQNIGMFFQFIKDDLKRVTISVNDEYKMVDDKNWKIVKLYSSIITKTYTYLQEYLQTHPNHPIQTGAFTKLNRKKNKVLSQVKKSLKRTGKSLKRKQKRTLSSKTHYE